MFEFVKSTGALKTLTAFNEANGDQPVSALISDAGDLFGTTASGGAGYNGTVFELPGALLGGATVDSTTSVIDNDPAVAVAPTITGTVAGQTTTSEAPIAPFSGVSIGDATNGGKAFDTLTISLGGAGGALTGAGLGGGGGVYTLSGTATAITSELDELSFKPTTGNPDIS